MRFWKASARWVMKEPVRVETRLGEVGSLEVRLGEATKAEILEVRALWRFSIFKLCGGSK